MKRKLNRPISNSQKLKDRIMKNKDTILMSANNKMTKKQKKCSEKTVQNDSISEMSPTDMDPNLSHDSSIEVEQYDDPNRGNKKNMAPEILGQRPEKVIRKVHRDTKVECDDCKMTFCSKSSLQRHVLLHLNLKPYSCSRCPDKKFRQQTNLRVHMALKHPEDYKKTKFPCRKCNKSFEHHEHLKLHQKAHLKDTFKPYNCSLCDKAFKRKFLLTQHEKVHTAPDRYKCSLCNMTFDSRPIYSKHLKSHGQLKNISCQYCGKVYLRPSSIARHIRLSHSGMRMKCPVCDKLLKGHLAEHMRTHEQHRPHECDECGQKFTQSTQLTVHKRCHTGDRPYVCKICDRPFSNSSALMLHVRRHTGEKPFECALCLQTFSQLPHMKAHMRSIHKKTEYFKCNNCNTFFKLKALLEAHSKECRAPDESEKQDTSQNDGTLISRMRYLLVQFLIMIASKKKIQDLGFNKRLIDDILMDQVEAMGLQPCKDTSISTLEQLRTNILMLLGGTVPKRQMALFVKEKKTTEEVLELLTDKKKKKK